MEDDPVSSARLQAALRHAPIFAELDACNLDKLEAISTWLDLEKGYPIIRQGYDTDSFYVVASGTVRIFKHSPRGREFTMSIARSGRTLGAASLIVSGPSLFSAETMAPTSLVALRREELVSFLKQNPLVALKAAEIVVEGFDNAMNIIMDLLTDEARVRVVKVLMTLCADFGGLLPFNHQQIADMAGVARETASEVLASLAESRITRSLRGSIAVLDKDRLMAMCPDNEM